MAAACHVAAHYDARVATVAMPVAHFMPDLVSLLQHGADNAWLFIPSTILMGALHGLEPGHSKTMMAAFIVAVRGTLAQAVMLGLAATASHTAVVWVVALVGMQLGQGWNAEATEPYFQLASAAMILLIGGWMMWRTWSFQHGGHDHHDHDHDHDHGRVHGSACSHGHDHDHAHDHSHGHEETKPTALDSSEELAHMDPHARAHALDIERRFAGRTVTNGQILMFGLTGGLIPCPASITVLLLCLQLKKVALGATLVLGFSVGLAITLVASGALAALSMRHASRRWSGFGDLAAKAPYASGALIMAVGLWVGWQGWRALA